MTDERIAQLNGIGFDWDPFETMWMSQFEQLSLFYSEHGHCNVAKTHMIQGNNLGEWVSSQRKALNNFLQDKPSSLTQERIDKLNTLNFVWNPNETSWNYKLALLCHFNRKHGHWQIPRNYTVENVNIGAWLDRQKRQFLIHKEGGPSALTPERLKKFEDVGFSFGDATLVSATG